MNNTQLYLATGIPVLANLCTMAAVITAQVLSRAQVNRLCAKIDGMCDDKTINWIEENRKLVVWFHERMATLESRD